MLSCILVYHADLLLLLLDRPDDAEPPKSVDIKDDFSGSRSGSDNMSRRRTGVTFNIQPIPPVPPPIPGPSHGGAISRAARHEVAPVAGPSGVRRTPPFSRDTLESPRSRSSSLSDLSSCPGSPTFNRSENVLRQHSSPDVSDILQ